MERFNIMPYFILNHFYKLSERDEGYCVRRLEVAAWEWGTAGGEVISFIYVRMWTYPLNGGTKCSYQNTRSLWVRSEEGELRAGGPEEALVASGILPPREPKRRILQCAGKQHGSGLIARELRWGRPTPWPNLCKALAHISPGNAHLLIFALPGSWRPMMQSPRELIIHGLWLWVSYSALMECSRIISGRACLKIASKQWVVCSIRSQCKHV